MFSLTIVFGPGPMVWTLMFKERKTAEDALAHWTAQQEDLTDDFGQVACVNPDKAHGWMLEDLEQSKFAHIERALHQTRTKIAADKIADSDPSIKEAARRAQGGMPMIQPVPGFGPNGGFRG